ncbi:MAG TPA: single-stranded-DNA-specific exonuclease RecJ [Terriglobales bacterium]|nr:single-stranded-DNA-specific exonuclease RecJ [Terriglobales bacterium]
MRWNLREVEPAAVQAFAEAISSLDALPKSPQLNAVVARLLLLRGITTPEAAAAFLNPSLDQLHSPLLMTGMKAAVERLEAAIERKEGILVYGDYDVDGTTAVVILKAAIELCGGTADFHVPHRIREGYDLRGDVIESAAAAGIRLVISVDSGTRAFTAAESAKRAGVDLIITDHHLPGPGGLPHAYAVVNPNQPGCEYPCKSLCGAGIAFKFAQALLARRLAHRDQIPLLLSFLKIAAIATIADSVPLHGENRVIASLGLNALRTAVNPGLKALLEVSRLDGRPLTSEEVAFRIAPRINAAGRMDIAADVIDLFTLKDSTRTREIAERLDKLNSDRQEEERRIVNAIEQRLAEEAPLRDSYCMVIDGEGWHRGVIGITATRVVERYGRPAIVISREGDEAHGSGRSISAFHLLNALESCAALFTRYGGHSHAVGFSLPCSRVIELRAHLDGYARARLTLADFEPALKIDAELPLESINPELFAALQRLEPFGAGNHEPVFCARGTRLTAPVKTLKEKHVRLKLSPGQIESAGGGWRRSLTYNAMGWRLAERAQQEKLLPGDLLDIVFSLGYNDHPDFGGLELSLRDFKSLEKASAQSSAT